MVQSVGDKFEFSKPADYEESGLIGPKNEKKDEMSASKAMLIAFAQSSAGVGQVNVAGIGMGFQAPALGSPILASAPAEAVEVPEGQDSEGSSGGITINCGDTEDA